MKRLVLPLILLAAPTYAATFTPPTGCTAYLTVQSRGCLVSQFYTCEADAKGEIGWNVSVDSTIAHVHRHGATAARPEAEVTARTGGSVG